jgi:hypothetical protein
LPCFGLRPSAAPDLRLQFPTLYGNPVAATLTRVNGNTRVVINAALDYAWIKKGRCPAQFGSQLTAPPLLPLKPFYSFRSVTLFNTPLEPLLDTPHMLLVDAGGAHGGDPIGCADLRR